MNNQTQREKIKELLEQNARLCGELDQQAAVKEITQAEQQSRCSALASNDFLDAPSREQITVIEKFVEIVERRAEEKMLKTGKLEGAHYAAMKQLLRELQEST